MGDGAMERHLSIGVTTIVALMAAHRGASVRVRPPAVYNQEEIVRIDAYLQHDKASALHATRSRNNQLTTSQRPS
jgi:hypothetical protein